MNILLALHFLGDYALQTDYMAKNKKDDWYVLLSHSMVWALCISAGLLYVDKLTLYKFIFLVSGHFMCDMWKAKQKEPNMEKINLFLDQGFHVIQIVIVYGANI
jgi:hypothetical protein